MKKKALLLVLLLMSATFVYVSCNKDDDAVSTNPKDLIGTWKQVSVEYDYQGHHSTDDCSDDYEIIVFNEDGTYSLKEWYSGGKYCYGSYSGEYTVEKGKLRINYSKKDYTDYDFSVSGNKLKMVSREEIDNAIEITTEIYQRQL